LIVTRPEIGVKIDRERHLRTDEQGVPVRRCLGDKLGRELVVGAGAMLDHHLPTPRLGKALRQHASERVDNAARRRRHDDRHRLGRIALRLRGARRERHSHQRRNDQCPQPHQHHHSPSITAATSPRSG
jgi:hypothetical protein